MRTGRKRRISIALAICLIFQTLGCLPVTAIEYEEGSPYQDYLNSREAPMASGSVRIGAAQLSAREGDVRLEQGYEGYDDDAVLTGEDAQITYAFSVPESGYYHLSIDYFALEGKGTDVARTLYIDGRLPFENVRELKFTRIWEDLRQQDGLFAMDSSGNDIRPSQSEVFAWQTAVLMDPKGFEQEALRFYLEEGAHTLSLKSVREPMAVGKITFAALTPAPGYDRQSLPKADNEGQLIKVQGEDTYRKSSYTIYPIYDRSSAATEPNDPYHIRLNTIGGSRWQLPGQWVSWKVEIPKDGLYKIAMKARQNLVNGAFSTRRLTIDGVSPYAQTENIRFSYGSSFTLQSLQADGEDMLFYLTEGVHELKLQVTLGDMGPLLQQVNQVMETLNDANRQIRMVTGSRADAYRDYQFQKQIPWVIEDLGRQSGKLRELFGAYREITGQNGEQAQILNKLYLQTKRMFEEPESIKTQMSSFSENLAALGTWMLTAQQQPLEIDYLVVASEKQQLPKANSGFFANVAFGVQSFIGSFITDYGNIKNETADVLVWVDSSGGTSSTGGFDQAQVLKQMITQDFTPDSGVRVKIQLAPISVLLQAILAGEGPDVALTLTGSSPVNYAVRNAVLDLSAFPDFEEVAARFQPSALTPFTFDAKTYALPESQSFYMMFYRRDILSSLGLSLPDTWEDVVNMLPVLQKNQMTFGMPTTAAVSSGTNYAATVYQSYNSFLMLLFQNGGRLYDESGKHSALSQEVAVDAFYTWTKYYTDYGLMREYDFVNRFRSGEVPIGIVDYTIYNTLSVFAPEISGVWGFAPVPGVRGPEGQIDRSVPGDTRGCVIFSGAKNQNSCWEFLKWWTSAKTQSAFGTELESIMGTAARYSTANMQAFEKLPWSAEESQNIRSQWQWVRGVPEVPGGYYTARNVDFAYRSAVINGKDPGDALEAAVDAINGEIASKRREFGLS